MTTDDGVPCLISCQWLNDKLKAEGLDNTVVVDVTWSSKKNAHDNYLSCHIPGAVYLNVLDGDHTDLYPRNLPKPEVFETNVQALGINDDTHVIVYSDTDNCGFFLSGRAWWTFKVFGHNKTSVLDGGLQKWKELKYTTSSEIPKQEKGSFTAKWNPNYHKQFVDVRSNLESKTFQVCDTRSSSQYLGDDSPGHIPGAENIPYGELIDRENMTLKSREQLLKVFADNGINLSGSVATHCNSGMSSCTVALAAELCGCSDVAVFHGGFTEWKANNSECTKK